MGSQRLAYLLTLSVSLNSGYVIASGVGDGIAGGTGMVGDKILGSYGAPSGGIPDRIVGALGGTLVGGCAGGCTQIHSNRSSVDVY